MSSGTACADHQLHHMKKTSFKDLDIVPDPNGALSCLVHNNYLPCNDIYQADDDDSDSYDTDHFRMYEFKVRRCTRSRSHDWTDCPFAHPGEKARRRDPSRFRYCPTVCSDFRSGIGCPRGDDCEFAHGVFECWLHPTRYRTEACKDGKNCKRKVCFFAHSPRELRILSDLSPKSPVSNNSSSSSSRCCLFCRSVSSPSASSPTSTLLGLSHFSRSPSLSPPMPQVAQLRAAAGLSPSKLGSEAMSYKEILSELVRSLEGIGMSQEVCSPAARSRNTNFLNLPLHDLHEQTQAHLSPQYCAQIAASGSGDSFRILGAPAANHVNGSEGYWLKMKSYGNENGLGSCGGADPDLGWVNDLLM